MLADNRVTNGETIGEKMFLQIFRFQLDPSIGSFAQFGNEQPASIKLSNQTIFIQMRTKCGKFVPNRLEMEYLRVLKTQNDITMAVVMKLILIYGVPRISCEINPFLREIIVKKTFIPTLCYGNGGYDLSGSL